MTDIRLCLKAARPQSQKSLPVYIWALHWRGIPISRNLTQTTVKHEDSILFALRAGNRATLLSRAPHFFWHFHAYRYRMERQKEPHPFHAPMPIRLSVMRRSFFPYTWRNSRRLRGKVACTLQAICNRPGAGFKLVRHPSVARPACDMCPNPNIVSGDVREPQRSCWRPRLTVVCHVQDSCFSWAQNAAGSMQYRRSPALFVAVLAIILIFHEEVLASVLDTTK